MKNKINNTLNIRARYMRMAMLRNDKILAAYWKGNAIGYLCALKHLGIITGDQFADACDICYDIEIDNRKEVPKCIIE